jgi:hypothetical protein
VTTGDEPMISQPGDDARSAYLTGNLGGIIYYLNRDQRLRFQKTLIQAGLLLAARIANNVPTHRGVPLYRNIVREIDRWLLQPNPQHASPALQLINDSGMIPDHGYDVLWDDFDAILASLAALIDYGERIDELTAIADEVLEITERSFGIAAWDNVDFSSQRSILRQWFLDVAWTILQNSEPPPFPEIDAS